MTLDDTLTQFCESLERIFGKDLRTVCLFGSATYGDLCMGYSDIDFFVLHDGDLTDELADKLFELRTRMRSSEANGYMRALEGEFIPIPMLRSGDKGPMMYWGTKSQRVKKHIGLCGFSLLQALENGRILYGEDLRHLLPPPRNVELLREIERLIETVREHAIHTRANAHSADWLFLVCLALEWLETGKNSGKTGAAKWAMRQKRYGSWTNQLEDAIAVRRDPALAKQDDGARWLSSLGPDIQLACDDLCRALHNNLDYIRMNGGAKK